MASFARGLGPRMMLLLRHQGPRECATQPTRLVPRARFSASRILQQTAARSGRPAAKAAPKPPAAKPAAAAPRPSTYAQQLALKGRTLLYEAPSHFWFRAGCFTSGAFCISYTVYQYWTIILHPPEGLYWWIPHAYGVILVAMAGMAAYFVMGAGRVVRSIEAVPAASVAKHLLAARAAAAGAGAATPSPIWIEVATRRMAPFLPPKKTLLLPEEVQLPFRMYSVFGAVNGFPPAGHKTLTFAEKVRAEREDRDAKIAARKYTMDHIMTAPFRDAGKAFGTAFAGIRRSFNRDGFVKIKLGTQTYKLDVTGGGWALDNGRAMDRLLAVRPNAMR
ncbi:hypothetical protein BT67DRAFT_371097 [Trichocladium antarcticum]|uniref:Uncharacterized protein n=1 Tax=Trichocladium antarcticum TaxID=1450529 RepID=A0AAN6URX8_9PEZI|nr:hypothetical protein BT67DRAFT_371097 [Trichocladium antarcticum]